MKISDLYKQTVLSFVQEIKKDKKPVFIFGAGRAGWYIMKVLEFYDVPITGFSANDPKQQQTTYYNYPIFSPDELYSKFPDAYIFLGIFMPYTAEKIKEQFQKLNFKQIHFNEDAFLYTYFVDVAGRKCDNEILAKSISILFENYKEGKIHYGYTKDGYFVSPFVTGVITQKCTLRCRDCAQLIPYYESPKNLSVETIVRDLKQYAMAFDVVPEISLHGGEPFLHKDIAEIVREVAAIPNIVFISFVTNGTLMLSEDKLKQLSESGADVHQSGGYGSLSKNRDNLIDAFEKHNIYSDVLFCSPSEMWTSSIPYKKHFRADIENNEQYKKCISSNTCCQIMNGELHRCALSMHGSHQGLIPKNENDFIRLDVPYKPNFELVNEIRNFLTRETALTVCDYCDPEGGILVSPAIQLSKMKTSIDLITNEIQKA